MERTSRTESLIAPVNAPPPAPTPVATPSPSKHARLVSLDIVRGFTVWLHIRNSASQYIYERSHRIRHRLRS